MKTLWTGCLVVVGAWAALKSGVVDLVLADMISTATTELHRLGGWLASLLVSAALPLFLVALAVAVSRRHRAIAVELGIAAVAILVGAHVGGGLLDWIGGSADLAGAHLSGGHPFGAGR